MQSYYKGTGAQDDPLDDKQAVLLGNDCDACIHGMRRPDNSLHCLLNRSTAQAAVAGCRSYETYSQSGLPEPDYRADPKPLDTTVRRGEDKFYR